MSRSKKPLWWIRLTTYEYWSFFALYWPTLLYLLYLAFRSRSLTFITVTNPLEEFGAFFGESKAYTLNKIQPKYLPGSTEFKLGISFEDAKVEIKSAGMEYPLIIKPDWGERGINVERVNNDQELEGYLSKTDRDSIVQEFIDYPIELGVFYYRYPDGSKSEITGISVKDFMTVVGNGRSTVEELMEQVDRYRFQIKRLRKLCPEVLSVVPEKGETKLLEPIGNHNRGTMFLDGSDRITPELVKVFDDLASTIDGFYFGRFDVKVKNWEGLYKGEGIKALELNGVYSEPAHIYDPKHTLGFAYKEIVKHYMIIYDLAKINRKRGFKPTSIKYFFSLVWKNYFKNKQVV